MTMNFSSAGAGGATAGGANSNLSAGAGAGAKLMDGKAVAAAVKERVTAEAARLVAAGVQPCLAVVLVGDDPASATYVRSKERACEQCGIKSVSFKLDAKTTEAQLLDIIAGLNADESVDGILVQLPLPKHIDTSRVIAAISADKDVDGFACENVGRLVGGLDGFVPCTPLGVMEMLRFYGVEASGKRAVVVGRSNIVGKPMANLLLNAGATVTIAHSKTRDLAAVTREAEILVVAVGRAGFITADMVGEGAVVVDVGINRVADESAPKGSRLVGDVDFAGVAGKAAMITPVPGGVGVMTIAMLMSNTIASAQRRV